MGARTSRERQRRETLGPKGFWLPGRVRYNAQKRENGVTLDDSENLTTSATDETKSVVPKVGTSLGGFLKEILKTALMALAVFLLLRIFVQNFRIEGHSMEPNLHDGQFLIVDKLSYKLHRPERGDIIVFHAPSQPNKDFIKRVIALPGEEVEIRQGRVYVNKEPLEEPYVPFSGSRSWGPQRVGSNELFVLGDNRASSNDSRHWGMLPMAQVVGKAFFSYWPPRTWGFMRHASYTAQPHSSS